MSQARFRNCPWRRASAWVTALLLLTRVGITGERPNIIYIYTDQQSASMMSCAGNRWLKTPGMDTIAENGIRFTRAYTANPVCVPARISMMTGRFPGYFQDKKGKPARENNGGMSIPGISEEVRHTTLAACLKEAGYALVYGGKEHLPPALRPEALGFRDICDDERGELAAAAAEYIRAEHEKPYFMIVSLINPHDICYMALRDGMESDERKRQISRHVECVTLDKALQMPAGVSEEEFFATWCPPLPENHEPQAGEPAAIAALLDQRSFRRHARDHYTDRDWRRHRWAYHRLTEFVDRHVQTILQAIREGGREEQTLVLFSSDHGDMDSAHRMEHKTALYEEAANIPFLAMWKGHIPPGRVDDKHLVSNGLDLLPTVCDYAGVKGVSDPRGRSLRALFEGKETDWRDTLGVESQIGRMVVSQDRFKYIRYDMAGTEEQLLDLNTDPRETGHVTAEAQYGPTLERLRRAFDTQWFPARSL